MSVELTGRVIERGTGTELPGLRVQAWRETHDVPSGEGDTGDDGSFTLIADTGDGTGEEPERVAFYFRVLHADELLLDTAGMIVWTSERPDLDLVIELDPPRPPSIEARGRLIGRDRNPLPGLVVVLRETSDDDVSTPLGAFRTDADGGFIARLGDGRTRLSAVICDDDGTVLADAQAVLRRDTLLVRCDLEPARRPDPPLTEALDVLDMRLPADYLSKLADAGVTTLAEFGRAPDELVEPDDAPDAVPTLRAAAGFRTLTPDLELVAQLTNAGYLTLGAVASAPAGPFAERVGLEPEAAAGLQNRARAQEAYLRTLIAGERSAMTRTPPAGEPEKTTTAAMSSAASASCGCCDCRSAVSPAAYLADLLSYTVVHVTEADQPLTLQDMTDLTRQPLRNLPLDCDSVDTTVPRLRIIVEVLRAHLAAEWANVPPDRRTALQRAERAYLSVAYARLLAEHGTSFTELRDAKVATAAERAALAARLGIDLAAPDPLAELLLDPNATPPQLTEAALERLFGYRNSTTDPLADVGPGFLADRRRTHQRQTWLDADHPADGYSHEREQQLLPTIDPDIVGTVDFRDQNPIGNPCFTLHAARRAWVDGRVAQLEQDLDTNGVPAVLATALGAPAPDLDQLAADLNGTAAAALAARNEITQLGLTPASFSRLMEVRAAAATPPATPPSDADLLELAQILTQAEKVRSYPTWVQQEHARDIRMDLQRFRLVDVNRVPERAWLGPRAARVAWRDALRRRSAAPVVNALLLGPVDFADPSPSGLVYQLWDDRRQFIATRIAQFGGGPPDLTVLDNRVRTVLDDMPVGRWIRLAEQYTAGAPLTEQLETYTITRPELGRLVRTRTALGAGLPVADDEWQVAAQVLTRVVSRRQHPRWRSEERSAGLVLGPDDFVLAGLGDVNPQPPLGTIAERGAWQDVLRARIDQDEAARIAALTAIQMAEQEALPLLRDALVAAIEVPATDPAERADWLGDRLLIDVLTGPTDRTTRIAQAIESLQVLLFALRTAQLTDTHPDLELVAENFDEEWQWIGGYPTWRAAIFVHLYPENLLLPSLRRHQTYGFRKLVAVLRSGRRVTSEGVRQEVGKYLEYFDDVTSLSVEAVAVAFAGKGESTREYTYLFAQADFNHKVYWSRDDATAPAGRTQSSWAPVTSLEGLDVTRVVGACPSTSFGRDWLYLIVEVFDDTGTTKLAFTRLDLERAGSLITAQDGGWSEYQELDPPDGAGDFQAVLIQDRYSAWPRIALRAEDTRFFLSRIVDTDWEEGAWVPRNLNWTGLPQGDLETLLSVVQVNGWGDLVFARYKSGTIHALFVATFQGLRSVRALSSTARIWQGAFLIDDTSQAQNPQIPRAGSTRVYGFWSDGAVSWYQSFGVATTGIFSVVTSSNSWLDTDGRLAVSGGDTSSQAQGTPVRVAFRRSGPFQAGVWNEPGQYLTSVRRLAIDSVLVEGPRRHIAPRFEAVTVVQIGEMQRDPQRRYLLDGALLSRRFWWDRPANALASNRDYLLESCGLVPLQVAQALQQRREYVAALDWYRVVYDYAAPEGSRALFPALVDELSLGADFDRAENWLLDTMNPHAVAETRRGGYTRSTILSIVRCLLEHADNFYSADTAEAIAQARQLYGTALDLLETDELRQDDGGCEDVIGELDVTVGGPEWVAVLERWGRELLELPGRDDILRVIKAVNEHLRSDRSWAERVDGAREVIDEALAAVQTPTPLEMVEQQLVQVEVAHRALMRDGEIEAVLARIGAERPGPPPVLELAGEDAAGGTSRLATRRAALSVEAGEVQRFAIGFGYWAPAVHFGFCVVPNPMPRTLRLWAELNLFKIRTSRNISGLERPVEAYAAPTDTTSGLPTIGAGGQLLVPGARSYRPTPYRYPQLVARARELAQLAGQVESSMFAAIQAGDQERYTRFKAVQDLAIGRAGVRLQSLRATEATGGVKVAELSKQRAAVSLTHYTELMEEGPTATEIAAMVTLGFSASFHQAAAISAGVAASISGSYAGALSSNYVTAALAPPQWAALASSLASASSSQAAALQTVSSMLSMQAGFERRLQEWELQRSLAAQDLAIADQQIQVAQDHVRVVAQEREIAQLTAEQAEQTIEFLDNKFTNVELYDFMAGELERVYGTVLEQAAATARMASEQLAFERQEDPPAFIRADYWQPSADAMFGADGDDGAADRRGLTGSARLNGDLVQLDGYAFDTERRKQHLTVTLSLAQLAPVEFARFRQTGELTFDTPGGWFDRQFPGHYLRLIRRVRMSVVALIPPNTGIRATLAQSGPSWVTLGGPAFSRVKVRGGGFDEVALSSPYADSGVFDLDPQPALRFPYEGTGLDARWTLRLPRAANPFDLGNVADILMTVEYTALSDANLRAQVIASLPPTTELTVPLSLRSRYPDQWYQLHNRRDAAPPFRISLDVPTAYLPPHLTAVQLSHVALLLAHTTGTLPDPITVDVLGRPAGNGVVGTGAVVATNGLASSRGNAQGWNSLPRDPAGTWILQFHDDQATRDLFDSGDLDDVLLALTVSGRGHPWV